MYQLFSKLQSDFLDEPLVQYRIQVCILDHVVFILDYTTALINFNIELF